MSYLLRRGRPWGFTLIELLVVITIIGILAAIALPNYIKAKDKAKEVQTKSAVKSIQVAVERYHVDFEEYPLFLLGGDTEGWSNWHSRFNEPTPDPTTPQNAWVDDPLIKFNYMDSYPQNPFVDNGNAVIQQTGPMTAPASGYAAGDGDPRFGFQGTLMGNGLEDPMIFANWFNDEAQNIESHRTLTTTTGGQADAKGFGTPDSNAYRNGGGGGATTPEGLHYTMGGRRTRVQNDTNIGTVFTHWPGNFFYRGFADRPINRKGWTVYFPMVFVKAETSRYIMGGYGSYTTEGQDVIRLEDQSSTEDDIYYRMPPPFTETENNFRASYSGAGERRSGGLPEIVGGGDDIQGPWIPPDRSPDFPGSFVYGSPDGLKDAAIIVLTPGEEVTAY